MGDAAGPGRHVGSRCHDVTNEILHYKLLAHPLIEKERKKKENTWNKDPKTTAGWIWRTNVYVSDKNEALEMGRFSFWDQCWYPWVYEFCEGFWWVCTKTPVMDRTVFNLFLFPKKPYCYCNIMETLMLYYDDLFYIT